MIRRDIFALKVWDYGHWCFERMDYCKELAYSALRDERREGRLAKLVHPSQWVVDAFVSVGNRIVDPNEPRLPRLA
jgi:hypothetical protein